MNFVQRLKVLAACGIVSIGAASVVRAGSVQPHSNDSQSGDCPDFHKPNSHDKKNSHSQDQSDNSCDWVLQRCDDSSGHKFKLKRRDEKTDGDADTKNDHNLDCTITIDDRDLPKFLTEFCNPQGNKHGNGCEGFDIDQYKKRDSLDQCWQGGYSELWGDCFSKGKDKGDESCDWLSHCHDDHKKCDGPPTPTTTDQNPAVPVPAAAWPVYRSWPGWEWLGSCGRGGFRC